ncbi:alpha/beta hydrolase [Candidatus Gracilibacteria bacterium]|nr:alpha/beta hydrolase [Candidatus Gracilibacteria bacterium]
MKSAIILHGMPSKEEYFNCDRSSQSNSHWLPWLQQQLIVNGVLTQTPELPEPYLPVYEEWCKVFEQFTIDEDTTLVGHSCGAGFLLRWLSENKIEVGKVVLVAPWFDPVKEIQNNFFDFEIDRDILQRVEVMSIFVSSDDEKTVLDSVEIITKQLPQVEVKRFEGKGHFTFGDMKTEKFPELLEYILG